MKRNLFETILGAVVLVVAGVFLYLAYTVTDIKARNGYTVYATFNKIGGLAIGNDVRISGVKVGSVDKIALDKTSYQARIAFSLENDVKLPTDTVAQVVTEGLMGGYYVSFIPGVEDDYIESQGEIQLTQPPVDLMDLLGRFVFSSSEEES